MGLAAPRRQFNTPCTPWWGGFWERMLQSVNLHLKKTLGTRSLMRCELEMALCKVECCVNSCPITFVGVSPDAIEPLTPAHVLSGWRIGQPLAAEPLGEPQPENWGPWNMTWTRGWKGFGGGGRRSISAVCQLVLVMYGPPAMFGQMPWFSFEKILSHEWSGIWVLC